MKILLGIVIVSIVALVSGCIGTTTTTTEHEIVDYNLEERYCYYINVNGYIERVDWQRATPNFYKIKPSDKLYLEKTTTSDGVVSASVYIMYLNVSDLNE